MKIVRYIINVVLSFLIILFAFILIGLNVLDYKILDKKYILSKIDEIKFYEQISKEVESGFENYIYQSGLPEETINDLFTEDMIKKDVNSLINCLYDGTEISLSTEILRETLDSRIQEYLASQNKKLNEEGKKNITKFEDLIVEEYRKNVNVSTTVFESGNSILQKVKEVRGFIGNIPIVAFFVLIVLIIIVNIKDLLSAMNFLGISALSTGVLLKIGTNLLFNEIDFDNLVVLSKSLSSLIINICKEFLYEISENATLYIVCGITAILVTAILKNINLKNKGEN